MGPENGVVELGRRWRRRVGETQALAWLRSTEAGAARPLDVLPAHLIPGGGPLSSMTVWWVLSLSKADWVVEGGGLKWTGWARLGCLVLGADGSGGEVCLFCSVWSLWLGVNVSAWFRVFKRDRLK